ncbi:MAG TPA: DUF2459 domain-containing protein [Spirochaetota bacterium]|nr:DUF2459 domain-containing protein [Spirochaetota bacterium]
MLFQLFKRGALDKIVALVAILSFCYGGCAPSTVKDLSAAGKGISRPIPVYLVNRGIHTGLVIPVNTVSEEKIATIMFFKDQEYVDFGWGDEDYYQKPGAGLCLGIKAVLLPTSSVMRVEGFSGIFEDVIRRSDFALRFDITELQFIKLCEYIDKSFRRDVSSILVETKRKRHGGVIFFKSVYYYHLFNTCNTWAARGLEAAGLDVSPFMVITAGDLYDEIKGKGVVLKKR